MINYQAQQQNADVNAQAVVAGSVVAGWQSIMCIATAAPIMDTPIMDTLSNWDSSSTCASQSGHMLTTKPALKTGKKVSKPLETLGLISHGNASLSGLTLGCEAFSHALAATRIHEAGHTGRRGFTGTQAHTG